MNETTKKKIMQKAIDEIILNAERSEVDCNTCNSIEAIAAMQKATLAKVKARTAEVISQIQTGMITADQYLSGPSI